MLIVVIAIFLLIEIPVALIFLLHFVVVVYGLMPLSMYQPINNLIIIRYTFNFRNFLIILTYPLNFAIYFGMSSSFQLQFRQLFTKKILYVAAPQSQTSRPPRFSVQLIDIHRIRSPSAISLLKLWDRRSRQRNSETSANERICNNQLHPNDTFL
uniref:G-protein coupled receptors family 1 profile domain-containing protein n=1 Tax=Ascaris lumbricoides TaxID=6252 RepID=A0A0M3HP80_ASCLU